MCDIFEDAPGPNEWRSAVWDLIRVCPWLDFQLLTKRPENIAAMLPGDWAEVETGDRGGYPNVWLGTSIEDRTVVERARVLAEIPAFRRFISYEPAIGPVFMDGRTDAGGQDERFWRSVPAGHGGRADPELDLDGIDWLIVGGESGSAERRPMNLDWARDAQAACYYAGVPFFFKQLGGAKPGTGEDALGEIVHEYPTSWDRADFVPDGQLV
jgi:protein gp37